MTQFSSLPNAVRAAIDHGNAYTDIRADRWADTYRCSTEDVKTAWETVLTARSQQPQNSYDTEGK